MSDNEGKEGSRSAPSSRRVAREKALQFLFSLDINPVEAVEEELSRFWGRQPSDSFYPKIQEFGSQLVRGVVENRESIDSIIRKHSRNWDFERIAVVDRNLIRIAIYEMLFCEDIPPVVSICEAIEIAKRFSTDGSGRFINGILDRTRQDVLRPARIPVPKL